MAQQDVSLYAFNRGLISRYGLGRVDLKRTAISAAQMTNWMPRVLGSMMFRPGTQFIAHTYNDKKTKHIPFVFSPSDTALIQFTDMNMKVLVGEAYVTRVSVGTTVTNPNFTTDLSGWTQADETGAVSAWVTGPFMSLIGTAFSSAIRKQTLTVAGGDQAKEHALRLVVSRGTVTLRVGTSDNAQDLIEESILGVGTHSLAFTPGTGNASVFVRLSNLTEYAALLTSCNIEGAGDMVIPAPYQEAVLPELRYDQSADVVFVACYGFQQRKVERRGLHSWSLVLFQPVDGPFRVENFSPTTITPSDLTGDITLTASQPIFQSTHVGSLWSITASGQTTRAKVTGNDQFSNPVKVEGVGTTRALTVTITGTWTGTISLQRSISAPGDWNTVQKYTGNTSVTYNDTLDNEILFYQIGFEPGNYGSGEAIVQLTYSGGLGTGIVLITGFTDTQHVNAAVVAAVGIVGQATIPGLWGTAATNIWEEGLWSNFRGWPSAMKLYEGRMWNGGIGQIVASVSDAYASFDETIEGDSGPINRTIGSGPLDRINWLLALERLILGGQSAEISIRSSALYEPLTPTDFNLKDASTLGSATADALKLDVNGIFVQRSTSRVYKLVYNWTLNQVDYVAEDLTALVPELGATGINLIALQRQPDTRIHCIKNPPAPGGGGGGGGGGTPATLLFVNGASCHYSAWKLTDTGNQPPRLLIEGAQIDTTTLFGADPNNSTTDQLVVGPSGAQYIFDSTFPTLGNQLNQICIFAKGADGNVAPTGTISGSNTQINNLTGYNYFIAVDAVENIYLFKSKSDGTAASLYSWPVGTTGNVAPTTLLSGLTYEAVDFEYDALNNQLWTLDFTNNAVRAYSLAGVAGHVISGGSTGLTHPLCMNVGPDGKIYVVDFNAGTPKILIFANGSNGNVAPSTTITGALTKMVSPNGIAVDANSNMYLTDFDGTKTGSAKSFVLMFAAGSSGNVAPSQEIIGDYCGLTSMIVGANTFAAGIEVGPGLLPAVPAYSPPATHFNSAAKVTSSTFAPASSRYGLLSVWSFNYNAGAATLLKTTAGNIGLTLSALSGFVGGSGIALTLYDSSNAAIVVASPNFVIPGWRHDIVSWDTQTQKLQWYVNAGPTDKYSSITWSSSHAVSFSGGTWEVGDGTNSMDIAELWFGEPASFFDLSVTANLNQFVKGDGAIAHATNLGSGGSSPGINPVLYLSGSGNAFATNQGTGGAFSLASGALSAASTTP